jgi:hypothetical protein
MSEFTGRVEKKPRAEGSKSEREAVVLVTEKAEYVLRRQGGNPFADAELDKLVGRRIHCRGLLRDYTFIMDSWTPLDAG